MRKPASSPSRAHLGSSPLSPMRPEIIRHYEQLQAEMERRGDWGEADLLNQWLAGAFTSEDDFLQGQIPPMWAEFLERWRNG